jgi:formylglycine-generating enzyme required for sulfatase activity
MNLEVRKLIVFSLIIGFVLAACGTPTALQNSTNTPTTNEQQKISNDNSDDNMAEENMENEETPTEVLPAVITDDFDHQMVLVSAGEFIMGSEDGNRDEMPVHTVYLNDYYIDLFEVTNELYANCVSAGDCQVPVNTIYYFNSDYSDHPVVYVNWSQAQAYCQWRGGNLPTEAQWEKAARGIEGQTYPWGEDSPDASEANYNENVGDTMPVGSYPDSVSPYGLYDMAGNVWEWVLDWHDGEYYANSPYENPSGPEGGIYRVIRGGSWQHPQNGLRASNRSYYGPAGTGIVLGFRCVSSP